MTLDPVHIGTGGYRLGRVDNTIVREPGTNLPKIPGTSLMGAARSYAAMYYGKPEAAGQHKNFKGNKETCPIIYTFGTATESGGGQAGKASIGDARILFFPVHSMVGPVWVSTAEILNEAGFKDPNGKKINDKKTLTTLDVDNHKLNLGWLLLKTKKTDGKLSHPGSINETDEWRSIENRIVLVSPKLFSQIVNSNLEVRTSVAINSETGAAEGGALFTYEALPRTTWLWNDIIVDDYSRKNLGITKQFKDGNENVGDDLSDKWDNPLDVVRTGLKMIEYLGFGGMSTRGFGRMKIVDLLEANGK